MSAHIVPFRLPYPQNDNNEYTSVVNTLSKAVKHIQQSSKFITQLQQPDIFHPHDSPSIEAYLKMSLILMERAGASIHDVLARHHHIIKRR